MHPRLAALLSKSRQIWVILSLAVKKFLRIDGAHWAEAFAFNVFLSLFPLTLLFITIASVFIDRDKAGKEAITYIEHYVPINVEMKNYIFDTIAGMIKARGQMSAVAFFILIWTATQCFTTLICATNHAWGTTVYNWWQLPLKSIALLGITAGAELIGMVVSVLMRMANSWLFLVNDISSWAGAIGRSFIPLSVVFISLSLFYKLAPRSPTQFSNVWAAALFATFLLHAAESLFLIYIKNFATLNAVYGLFGGIMSFLLWIYLSGCIFIFGACLCAAQAEKHSAPIKTISS